MLNSKKIYLKKNSIIISLIFLIILIILAIYFSPYYLDNKNPYLEIQGIDEDKEYRGILEFAVDCYDKQVGIKIIKVFVEENIEFEKKLKYYPKQHREQIKIDTTHLTDGKHELFIELIDGSWRRNHNKAEFVITIDNNPPEVEFILKPQTVLQGNTLMVIAHSQEPLVNLQGNIFNRDVKFYPNKGYYRSLVGISVHQEIGQYILKIIAEDKAGNFTKKQKTVRVIEGKFEKGIVNLSGDKKRLLTDNEARKLDYAERAKAYSHFEPKQLWQGKSVIPVNGRISSSFGQQRVYNNGVRKSTHLGIDIANVIGTNVKASNSGVVVLAKKLPISGNAVIIDHGQKVFSVYYHLNKIYVHKEEEVKKGQTIGEVGTTGQSTGPHLHWGFIVNALSVNPLEWTQRDFSYGKN